MEKRYQRIVIGFGVFSIIVALVQGAIYYFSIYGCCFGPHYLAILYNAVKCFFFSPVLTVEDILSNSKQIIYSSIDYSNGFKNFVRIVEYCYSIAIVSAPFCTLTILTTFLGKLIGKIRNFKSTWAKEQIAIFGNNQHVYTLLQNENNSPSYPDSVIHLFLPKEIAREKENELIGMGVILHKTDWIGCGDERLKKEMQKVKFHRIKEILLMENSINENFSLYVRLNKIGLKFGLLHADAQIHVQCNSSVLNDIFIDYYNDHRGIQNIINNQDNQQKTNTELSSQAEEMSDLCQVALKRHEVLVDERKYLNKAKQIKSIGEKEKNIPSDGNTKPKSCLPPLLFNLPTMQANQLMEHLPENIHLSNTIIAGFGSTGQSLLKKIVNQAVDSSNQEIVINIVDRDISDLKDKFLLNIPTDCYRKDIDQIDISNEQLDVKEVKTNADGKLTIRFNEIDIFSPEFLTLLRQQCDKGLKYVAFCVDDEEAGLNGIYAINRVLSKAEKLSFGIAISLERDAEIADYLTEKSKHHTNLNNQIDNSTRDLPQVYFSQIKDYLTLKTIVQSEREKKAKEFHASYNALAIYNKYEDSMEESKVEPWNSCYYYKQESSRVLYDHQKLTEGIVKRRFGEDTFSWLDGYFGKDGCLLERIKKNVYVRGRDFEDILDVFDRDLVLLEFAKTEHRRWCYSMILEGWSFGDIKDEDQKTSPYLTDWDILVKKHSDMCIYDLNPLIRLYEKYYGENKHLSVI